MRAAPAALLAAAALALALAPAAGQRRGPPQGPGWADPSDALAADIAFSRLAQEKGRWAAFRATAAKNAQAFEPGPVSVEAWLKGRKEPADTLKWQPHAAWMACDGSYAVTRGAWQSSGPAGKATGWYVTVWQRQDKGGYKWVLDQGDATPAPVPAPDFLTAKVAECPPRRRPPEEGAPAPAKPAKVPLPTSYLSGASPDGSLAWATVFAPGGEASGKRRFTVSLRGDGALRDVTTAEVK